MSVVFSHLPFVINANPQPSGRGGCHILHGAIGQLHPYPCDGIMQPFQRCDGVIILQLLLHDSPQVFDGVGVRQVPPSHSCWYGNAPCRGGMAWCHGCP
jgi:hypothetical protein